MKLPIFLAVAGISLPATGTVIELDPIRVMGTRPGLAEAHVGSRMATAKPVDVAEILSRRADAVDYVRKGPVAGDFLLRGLGGDNIVVTLDGCQISGACPNRMDPPAFHASSQQIRRITLRTGPFDVESGGNVGGVVRVETGIEAGAPPLRLTAYAGSHDYYGGGITLNRLDERLGFNGGMFYQEGGVYKDGSGRRITEAPTGPAAYRPGVDSGRAFAIWNGQARLQFPRSDRGEWNFSAGWNDATEVLYPGLRMDGIHDRSLRGVVAYSHQADAPAADRWSFRLSGSVVDHDMDDRFRLSSQANPAFAARKYMMRTEAGTSTTEIAWLGEKGVAEWELRYGFDVGERRWDADNIIMMRENDMIPNVLARQGGAWLSGAGEAGDWTMEIGGRLDGAETKARDDLSLLQSSQGLDRNRRTDLLPAGYLLAGRRLGHAHVIESGLGHGARLPDAQERYIQLGHPNPAMPDRMGNPALKPVRNTEWQANLSGRHERLTYRAGLFHAWLTDYIYPVQTVSSAPSGKPMRTYENIDATLWGVHSNLGWTWSDHFRSEAGLSWQRGRKSDLPTGNDSRVLGEIPPLRGRLALIAAMDSLEVMAEGLFADSQNRIDRGLGEQRLSGYGVLNLQASWEINDMFTLSGGVDNLLDKTYAVNNAYVRDPFGAGVVVNEPGRFVFVRLTASF